MIGWLLVLMLFISPAHAFLLRAGTPANCLYTGTTTVGSCINFSNSGMLSTTDGGTWKFTTAMNLNSTSGGGFNISSAVESIFCKSASYDAGAIATQRTNLGWWNEVAFEIWQQQISPCTDSSSYFLVNGTPQNSMFSACANGTASASIEIKPNPNGFWYGFDPTNGNDSGCVIGASGATFTLDSGAIISTGYAAGGAASLQINAANVTFNGAGATLCCQSFSEVNEMLDAVTNNAVNPTIDGATGNPFTIDCMASTGQEFSGNGPTGILIGPVPSGTASTVTISNVTVQNCGTAGSGQNHGIYIGWGTGSSGNTAYCETLSNVTVRDSGGDTNALKIDATCGTTEGSVVNTAVYCDNSFCPVNEALDMQCGGWHSVTNGYFEIRGTPSEGDDQFTLSKIDWGTLGTGGCQSTAAPTQSVHFDKDVFVYDGPTNGAYDDPSTGEHKIVACGSGPGLGNNCNANASGHVAVCITNSQIVDSSTDQTALLEAGPGVYVDSGCTGSGPDTNTYYSGSGGGRGFACGVASNWPSDGHSCAYPYVPQYIAQNETHDQLVAEAHAAGRCGEGTQNNPIHACRDIFVATLTPTL